MADATALPSPDPPAAAPPKRKPSGPKRPYSRAGVSSMKNAIRVLGRRTIDMRTATGKWLTARCEEYARDLGGDDALSQQQRTIIRLVVFDELVLQSGQAWLMRQDALVSARRRAFLPVVRELTQLGESIARKLSLLGLGPRRETGRGARGVSRPQAARGRREGEGAPARERRGRWGCRWRRLVTGDRAPAGPGARRGGGELDALRASAQVEGPPGAWGGGMGGHRPVCPALVRGGGALRGIREAKARARLRFPRARLAPALRHGHREGERRPAARARRRAAVLRRRDRGRVVVAATAPSAESSRGGSRRAAG